MDIDAYCERIGYSGSFALDRETLFRLHKAHCLAVPFENLDIQLGREIPLDAEAAYEKIVVGRRGGFCYELNLLFCELLKRLGYEVAILEGRVVRNGAQGLSYGHLMLRVELETSWLVDVGFGDGSLIPLDLSDRGEMRHPEGRFQIKQDSEIYTMWCQTLTEDLEPQYQFDLQPRQLAEFSDRCKWTQTSPDSGFVQRLICSLPIEGGRTGILGSDLVTFRGGKKSIQALSRADRDELLRDFFGIDLGGAELP